MSLAVSPTTSTTITGASPRVNGGNAPALAIDVPGNRPREDRFDPSGATPTDEAQAHENADESSTTDKQTAGPKGQELTPDERQVVAELQLRDRDVRAHEAAHKAAGGAAVGGASYTYQQGPDGRQYAIGGEVPVDLSTSGGSPETVIAKMAQVRAAALAPGDPSPQDHAVAAAADAIAAQARRELQTVEAQELQPETSGKPQDDSTADQSDDAVETQPDSSPAREPLGVSSNPEGGRINGRAMAAYQQAQEAMFAQGLINQRA